MADTDELKRNAREVCAKLFRTGEHLGDPVPIDPSAIIAEALMAERLAERERNAKIVEGIGDVGRDWALTSFMGSLRRDIAAAIRRQQTGGQQRWARRSPRNNGKQAERSTDMSSATTSAIPISKSIPEAPPSPCGSRIKFYEKDLADWERRARAHLTPPA